MDLQGRGSVVPDILASFSFILFYSTSASTKNTLTSLLLTKQTLQMAEWKKMHATLFWWEITRNLWRKQHILGNRNLFKPSQIEVRYFVRYTNVLFGLSIEPQIPVFNKNHEPARSPTIYSSFLLKIVYFSYKELTKNFFLPIDLA